MQPEADGGHPLLVGMNPQQAAAITAGDGPTLVLAGPGSGKTAVLTRRIAWLVRERQVPHHRILAVTFTNKAAGEMRARVEGMLGDRLRGMPIGTFHGCCARFLRREAEGLGYRRDWVIYDSDDQLALVKAVIRREGIDSKSVNPRAVLGKISNAKNEMIGVDKFAAYDYFSEIVKRVYAGYQAALRDANAMDFDDLLLNMVSLLRDDERLRAHYQRRFDFVLVDEFQDTNKVQYELVKLLAAPRNNVFAVGDEDQGVYSFRGANLQHMQYFQKDYPETIVLLLEQNYRSTQNILDVARAVIDRNPRRRHKDLFTELGEGPKIRVEEAYSERDEAEYLLHEIETLRRSDGLDYKDFAVMYRVNVQSRAIEQAFVSANVPHVLVGGVGFYKRREVKDLLAYLRLAHNPDDRISFERVVNTPARGIGKKSLAGFMAWVSGANLRIGDALNRLVYDDPTPLSTSAKKKLRRFAEMLMEWQELAKVGDLVGMFDAILAQTKYRQHLAYTSKLTEEAMARADNLDELRALLAEAAEDGQPLHEFLAEHSLVADVDSLKAGANAVTLMTLHSAKGLEFPAVFIVGLEQGLLPHSRAFEEPDGVEEERRLFYVGVTRAKRRVFLSYAFRRAFYQRDYGMQTTVSEFLADLPQKLLEGSPLTLATLRRSQSVESQTVWERPSSPSRLERDLKAGSVTPSDERIRNKIRPFDGGASKKKDNGFRVGANVSHPEFGTGKVIGTEHGGEIVSVSFDANGPKKIFADADGLKLLDE